MPCVASLGILKLAAKRAATYTGFKEEERMVPAPTAIGLILCEKIIVEEGTRRLTLVNSFTKRVVPAFPSPPQSFLVFAALIGGIGDATMKVKIERLDSLEEVYSRSRVVHFQGRLTELQTTLQVDNCRFPVFGKYQITLLVDGDWVAHRQLRLALAGGSP
jgi:hypothetical protein